MVAKRKSAKNTAPSKPVSSSTRAKPAASIQQILLPLLTARPKKPRGSTSRYSGRKITSITHYPEVGQDVPSPCGLGGYGRVVLNGLPFLGLNGA